MKFRGKCKNTELKHIFFKVINGDSFSNERMCIFVMVNNNRCERCEEVETIKHLKWDYEESRIKWYLFYHKVSLGEYWDVHTCRSKHILIQIITTTEFKC